MAKIRGDNHAFGWPGREPRWTHVDKDGIDTAYSAASRIWFTIWNGIPGAVHYLPEEKQEYLTAKLLRLLRMVRSLTELKAGHVVGTRRDTWNLRSLFCKCNYDTLLTSFRSGRSCRYSNHP